MKNCRISFLRGFLRWQATHFAPATCWLGPCMMGIVLGCAAVANGQPVREAWVRRYNFEGIGSQDQARKVVTDRAGNVIVAGTTDDGTAGKDILIIKYSGA